MVSEEDETTIVILGSITSFFIFIIFVEILVLMAHLDRRRKFWNLAATMQKNGGEMTLETWVRYVATGGDHGYNDVETALTLAENIDYDPKKQPPEHSNPFYQELLENFKRTQVEQLKEARAEMQRNVLQRIQSELNIAREAREGFYF